VRLYTREREREKEREREQDARRSAEVLRIKGEAECVSAAFRGVIAVVALDKTGCTS